MDESTENSILKCLKILEIIINIISYIPILFSLYFLHKNSVFHINMIRLCKCLILYYTISQLMRLIIAFNEFEYDNVIDWADIERNYLVLSGTRETKIYGFIRAGCIVAVFASVGSIIFERVFATIQLETYEKNVSNIFFFFGFSYHISNGLITVFIIYNGMINLKVLGIWIIFNNIGGYFALHFIHWFNRRRYCTALINSQKYTLSERYQLQENVRVASKIRKAAAMKFFINFFIGTIIFTAEFYQTKFTQNLTYLILNHGFNFYAFVFLFMGFTENGKMWPSFITKIQKWQKQASATVVSQIETPNQQRQDLSKKIRDINGKQMVFSVEEERKLYFEQLKNGWN